MELTVATATSRYVLSAEDLARYPESLLSTAYKSQLDGSAGIVLDFDSFELPTDKFPHISREAVAGLVHGVYRDGKMGTVLDTLITHVKTVQTTGSTNVFETLHEELSRLLDYLHLPGAVTGYLAPVKTLDLRQGQQISFMYTAHDLEQANMVVNAMLSYKPHSASQQPRGAAAFLVRADTRNTLPVAKVYVLLCPPEHLLSSVMQKCDRNPFAISCADPYFYHSDNCNVMRTRAAAVRQTSHTAEAETIYSYLTETQGTTGQFVSASDKWLGQQLLRVLAAHMPKGLKAGCCDVSSRCAVGDRYHQIPVWVLMW